MNAHVHAATRARLLANVLTTHGVGPYRQRAPHATVMHLHAASEALLDHHGPVTGNVPTPAGHALRAAQEAARAFPAVADVIAYVTEPVTGHRPALADLDPVRNDHTGRDRAVRGRLLDLREHGRLDDHDERVASAAFASLVDIHADHAELAADIADDARRDHTRAEIFRTHDGKRTAEHLPGHLAVFARGRIVAEHTVPDSVTPGDIWQLIAAA